MKLTELQYTPELVLSTPSVVHRVQRLRARRGSIAIGPLRVPPRGLLLSRFDLQDEEVGYFAETPEAAIYEALARREVLGLSLDASANAPSWRCAPRASDRRCRPARPATGTRAPATRPEMSNSA